MSYVFFDFFRDGKSANTMEIESTLQRSLPIIRLLKYMGLFPCSVIYLPKPFEDTISVSPRKHLSFKVENHSWKTFLVLGGVQIYFGMRLAFGYIQLLRVTVSNVGYNFSTIIGVLSGNLMGTCAFGITVVAQLKRKEIAVLLNRWQQTEIEIGSLMLIRKSARE